MNRIIIFSIVVLIFVSCQTYKPYVRTEIKTDSIFGENITTTDTTSLANIPLTELFSDQPLQSLIQKGLYENSDMQIARQKVTEAEATLKASTKAFLPSLSLNPQGQLSSFDSNKAGKTYSLISNASWEMDAFGKLTNQRHGAVASTEESKAYEQAVKTQLIATIAGSYYNLLMLDAQLSTSQLSAGSMAETVRTLEIQQRVGDATEAAVSQARANKLAVDASVLQLQNQIRQQENALCTLIGDTPHTIIRTSLTKQQFPEKLNIGLPFQLLDKRPDIREAEYALMKAYYNTNIARAAFYPSITLSGSAGWTNNSGSGIVNPGKLLFSTIGSIVQPIFNRGLNTAQLKIAQAQQKEAQLNLQQKLLVAGKEINDALNDWQTACARFAVGEDQIKQMESTVKSTYLLMQYSSGGSYLEVLTAQQSLLQAQLTHQNDCFAKIKAVITLYHALGGGI